MIEKTIEYNVEVFADKEMDQLRKTRCLCLNCKYDSKTCESAEQLYNLAVKENLAMMITRCPKFSEKI